MNLLKITLDNAQSGGARISIRSQGKLIWQDTIHLMSKRDDIEILSINIPNKYGEKIPNVSERLEVDKQKIEATT